MIAHQLSIQVSKYFFLDEEGIVQSRQEALRAIDALSYGLQPTKTAALSMCQQIERA